MSKKKVNGNTMTLKDFHGGSIPSDLPLPSAPGVTLRTSDRPGYDRSSSWGTSMGRPDHWSRPHTSPGTRHYDDKTPFLPHTAPIGRNFDEDERKPLDGVSAPRRTISDESIRALPRRDEVKPEYGSGGSSFGRQVAPVSQALLLTGNSYSVSVGMNPHSLVGSNENVWSMRKEVASVVEPKQSAWASAGASKLAHASALEKVSSGRWQSKAIEYQYQADAEVIRPDLESRPYASVNNNGSYKWFKSMSEKEYHDAMLARHAEKVLVIDNPMQVGRNELLDYEILSFSKHSEVGQRSAAKHSDGIHPGRDEHKLVGSDLPHPMPSIEPTERPKLKLLPRTKPLENSKSSVIEYGQVNNSGHVETVYPAHGHANSVKPVSVGTNSGKEIGQRLKLNLKPRSQPLEQLDGNSERNRNALFGGARPRELVLKERGIDDVANNNYDVVEQSNRVESNISRAEKPADHSNQTRYGEKTEDTHHDQRTGKKPERKEQRVDVERVHTQRRNWPGDNNRRNGRETDRQQASERQPSPETWRKPVEQPNSSSGAAGIRYGRAASALELAQSFSRSGSDPKVNDRVLGQRGPNPVNRSQVPFSRLVGPTSRPQINGY